MQHLGDAADGLRPECAGSTTAAAGARRERPAAGIGNGSRQSQTYTVTDQRALAHMQQQAANFRRALGACLDARGYSVK